MSEFLCATTLTNIAPIELVFSFFVDCFFFLSCNLIRVFWFARCAAFDWECIFKVTQRADCWTEFFFLSSFFVSRKFCCCSVRSMQCQISKNQSIIFKSFFLLLLERTTNQKKTSNNSNKKNKKAASAFYFWAFQFHFSDGRHSTDTLNSSVYRIIDSCEWRLPRVHKRTERGETKVANRIKI